MKKILSKDVLFLLSIIILAIGIGMIVNEFGYQRESFISGFPGFPGVPGIKQYCNPIIRRVRNFANDKIDKFTNHSHVLLKKFKIV